MKIKGFLCDIGEGSAGNLSRERSHLEASEERLERMQTLLDQANHGDSKAQKQMQRDLAAQRKKAHLLEQVISEHEKRFERETAERNDAHGREIADLQEKSAQLMVERDANAKQHDNQIAELKSKHQRETAHLTSEESAKQQDLTKQLELQKVLCLEKVESMPSLDIRLVYCWPFGRNNQSPRPHPRPTSSITKMHDHANLSKRLEPRLLYNDCVVESSS